MKQQIIESIIQQMLQHLDNVQLQRLKSVLEHELFDCEIKTQTKSDVFFVFLLKIYKKDT